MNHNLFANYILEVDLSSREVVKQGVERQGAACNRIRDSAPDYILNSGIGLLTCCCCPEARPRQEPRPAQPRPGQGEGRGGGREHGHGGGESHQGGGQGAGLGTQQARCISEDIII